jgi:hypothetical protein
MVGFSSVSCPTATAIVMHYFRSFTLQEVEEQKLLSLIYAHKKKSRGFRSGLLGGQIVSVMFWSVKKPIQRRSRF